jgi:hypothetical protein
MATIIGRFGRFSTLPTENQSPDLYVPIVTVGLANDPRGAQTGGPANLLAANLTAVIDTGGQLCAIDAPLAERYQLPVIRREDISGATGVLNARVFYGQLFFSETASLHEVELVEVAARSMGWAFDIAIGWSLLRLFDLRFSRRRNLVELEP